MKTLWLMLLAFTLLTGAEQKQPALSMYTYKQLTAIEALIQKQQLKAAGEKLHAMLDDLPESAVDRAYIFNTAGMYYLQSENYKEATRMLRRAYDEHTLSEAQILPTAELIGNLYMHSEQYTDAAEFYEAYLKMAPEPKMSVVRSCAVAYYQQQRYADAAALLEKQKEHFTPDENLYRILFASYYALKQHQRALKTADEMVKHWNGKREYWLQLSSLYYETGKRAEALSAIELAYYRGVLEKESDYMRYIYLLVEMQIPYKAAELLERFIAEKKVSDSESHLKLLEQCRIYARETAPRHEDRSDTMEAE